jgi:hypothetical protein
VADNNDYAILNGKMYDDGAAFGTGDDLHRPNWLNDGAWQGLSSGLWSTDLYYQGLHGSWWSSTANSATTAYGLDFDTADVRPANYNYKYYGRAVRCVLNPINP